MTSKIQIINFALRLIKQSPIVDIREQNERARVAADMYESTRHSLFEMCDWNCLRKRTKLTKDATAPEFGFKNRFILPADCLRVIGMQYEKTGFFIPYYKGLFPDDNPVDLTYTIEGRYLLTNFDEANILYIKDEEDTTRYDALMVNAFEHLLALNMSIPLAADNALTSAIQGRFDAFLRQAKAKNALATTYPAETTMFVKRRYY